MNLKGLKMPESTSGQRRILKTKFRRNQMWRCKLLFDRSWNDRPTPPLLCHVLRLFSPLLSVHVNLWQKQPSDVKPIAYVRDRLLTASHWSHRAQNLIRSSGSLGGTVYQVLYPTILHFLTILLCCPELCTNITTNVRIKGLLKMF